MYTSLNVIQEERAGEQNQDDGNKRASPQDSKMKVGGDVSPSFKATRIYF